MHFIYKKGIWLIALIAIAVALIVYESDWLWKIQSLNLFLYSRLFFEQQMVVSGGFLSYLGMFFTQFLYHPWLGVMLLCGLWWLLMEVTKRAFQISSSWNVLMLIPVALLLVANVDLGYWIYELKLPGYFFAATIGTTFAITLVWGYRYVTNRFWAKTIYIVLTCLIGYPLMGIYALVAALLMTIIEWRMKGQRSHTLINTVVALLSIVAVPLLCYRYVFAQTNMDFIYLTGIPSFTLSKSYPTYYLPYIILGFIYVFFAVTSGLLKENKLTQKKWLVILFQAGMAVLLALAVFRFWFRDENFHHELVMQHCIEKTDWEGVLNEALKQDDEPTRSVVLMRNLALTRLGMATQKYNYPNGAKKPTAPFTVKASLVCGRLIYYHYGMLNDSHRMCLEVGVEFNWNIEILQYMARCSLLSSEKQVTKKYLNLLKQTLYYDQWAVEYEKMLTNPKLIKQSAETGPVTHMMHYSEVLGEDDAKTEKYLMLNLGSNDSDDPYFQEQAVLATLWLKDNKRFWKRLLKYVELHPKEPLPVVFQEAAILFANLKANGNANEVPVNDKIKKSYKAFMKELQQFNNQTVLQAKQMLYLQYGQTYFYDYYLMNNLNFY